jgi:hypothetical protein
MSLRARIRAVEAARGGGCQACRGRKVWRTVFSDEVAALLGPPVELPACLRPSPFCGVCGRDCTETLLVEFDPPEEVR